MAFEQVFFPEVQRWRTVIPSVAPAVAPAARAVAPGREAEPVPRRAKGKRSVDPDGSIRVHGKRPTSEGSIYRDINGAWRATYVVPGERRPRRVRGRTRAEALARRAESGRRRRPERRATPRRRGCPRRRSDRPARWPLFGHARPATSCRREGAASWPSRPRSVIGEQSTDLGRLGGWPRWCWSAGRRPSTSCPRADSLGRRSRRSTSLSPKSTTPQEIGSRG